MKTFLRKVKLSFLAMLCGWAACNIAMWIVAAGYELFSSTNSLSTLPWLMLAFGTGSGIVILAVWLVIFLPVDLLVPDQSPFRRPKAAASAGFGSAFIFVVVYVVLMVSSNPGFGVSSVFIPAVLLAGITGAVAAYVRARMDQPKPRTVP